MKRRPVDELLDAVRQALEQGDREHAHALLAGCEGRWYLDGWRYAAGELGFARRELERGSDEGAVEVLVRLAAGRTMR